jgi:hypothetical protein
VRLATYPFEALNTWKKADYWPKSGVTAALWSGALPFVAHSIAINYLMIPRQYDYWIDEKICAATQQPDGTPCCCTPHSISIPLLITSLQLLFTIITLQLLLSIIILSLLSLLYNYYLLSLLYNCYLVSLFSLYYHYFIIQLLCNSMDTNQQQRAHECCGLWHGAHGWQQR